MLTEWSKSYTIKDKFIVVETIYDNDVEKDVVIFRYKGQIGMMELKFEIAGDMTQELFNDMSTPEVVEASLDQLVSMDESFMAVEDGEEE